MLLLILGKVWPEPGSSAAGSRMLQLIRLFKEQGWTIAFASAANTSGYSADLNSPGISSYTIELNSSSFDTFLKQLQPSAVLFDRFSTEEQFGWRVAEHCPNAIRILDMEDLHCLRAARQEARNEKREFKLNDLANDTAKRELASIYRCDVSLVISEYELLLLKDFFKVNEMLLHYLPFLQDPISAEEEKQLPGFAERRNFISIGNFLHAPNMDAVLYLKEEIWPAIRKQLPRAELEVYGAYAPQKAIQLHQPKDGFLVKGRAGTVEDVMSKARICLAPLRFGAGLKGKLLDAMRYGTPSITTGIGTEGMQGQLAWNGRVAETASGFAAAAVALYSDETEWHTAQAQGIQIYNARFDRRQFEQAFMNSLLQLQRHLPEHRLGNFTGAMLFHHSLLSTKYMALWIEAKNKQPD